MNVFTKVSSRAVPVLSLILVLGLSPSANAAAPDLTAGELPTSEYGANNWTAEARSYQNSYTTPVVIGQVMSTSDANWSTFWSMGASRQNTVDAGNLNVGKHVGQDSNNTRADEASLGPATVQCFGDSATPYSCSLSGSLATVGTAAVSQSCMSGNDGAWAVLSGTPHVTTTSLNLHVAEDEFKDSRQRHSAESVAYIVFE